MRRRVIFFLTALCVITLRARAGENAQAIIEAAKAAEAHADVKTALELYRQADTLEPNNPVILQKISKQISDSTEDIADPKQREKLTQDALAYSERALALAPHDPVCLLSLAVCYGKLTATADNATRVDYSRRVKRYAEEALAADPNYAWAHHILGKWNLEVAQLGGPTRVAARLLYGGLPPASSAEAIKHLEKAVELQPELPAHHVELGFAYLTVGDRTRALEQLRKGVALPTLEKHDESCKARARVMLEKLDTAKS